MLGVAAVFAQLTHEMIAENVKDGLMRRAQAGHHGPKKRDGCRHVSYSHYTDVQRGACKSFHKSAQKLETAVIGEVRKAAESEMLEKVAADEIRKELAKTSVPPSPT